MHLFAITLDGWSSVAIIVSTAVIVSGLALRGLKKWVTEDTATPAQVRAIVKETVQQEVAEQLVAITTQVTPNGGDTDQLGDRVQRMEEQNLEILELLRPRKRRYVRRHDDDPPVKLVAKKAPAKKAPAKKAAPRKTVR